MPRNRYFRPTGVALTGQLLFLYLNMSIPDRIRILLEPIVQQMGLDLVAVEWLGVANGMLLRLSIEGPEGVTAKLCAKLSRAVSPILDEDDPIS